MIFFPTFAWGSGWGKSPRRAPRPLAIHQNFHSSWVPEICSTNLYQLCIYICHTLIFVTGSSLIEDLRVCSSSLSHHDFVKTTCDDFLWRKQRTQCEIQNTIYQLSEVLRSLLSVLHRFARPSKKLKTKGTNWRRKVPACFVSGLTSPPNNRSHQLSLCSAYLSPKIQMYGFIKAYNLSFQLYWHCKRYR